MPKLDPRLYGLETSGVPYPKLREPAGHDLSHAWLTLLFWILAEQKTTFLSGSGRKHCAATEFTVPGAIWEAGYPVDLSSALAYGGKSDNGGKVKLSRLSQTYLNKESCAAAREKLEKRIARREDYTSVTVSLVGGDKDKRSQGHCMAALVVTHVPKTLDGQEDFRVTIFYRVTEVIRKFGADLAFLYQIVLPSILPDNAPPLTQVEFRFSNIYFSRVYLPVLWEFLDPVTMLRFVDRAWGRFETPGTERFFKSLCQQNVWPAMYPEKTYSYRERQIMHSKALGLIADGVVDGEALKQYVIDRGAYTHEDLEEE